MGVYVPDVENYGGDTMHIRVNGEKTEIQAQTIAELVSLLEPKTEGLVVQLNQEILERTDWGKIGLKEDDRVELIKFVGGGA